MVVSYTRGFSEKFQEHWQKQSIQVYFKEDSTKKNLLVAPAKKTPMTQKSEMIYRYKCDRVECDGRIYVAWVCKNIWTDLKNTSNLLLQFMTILTGQVITLV